MPCLCEAVQSGPRSVHFFTNIAAKRTMGGQSVNSHSWNMAMAATVPSTLTSITRITRDVNSAQWSEVKKYEQNRASWIKVRKSKCTGCTNEECRGEFARTLRVPACRLCTS